MYKDLAKYYDKIYYWKDYEDESVKIHGLIKKYKRSAGNGNDSNEHNQEKKKCFYI